jgi:Protein involved in biosynthesis of mitomycin antibiotics/polyketide fumonisin
MEISESQKALYAKEGYMIVPGYLNNAELEAVRAACDQSTREIEEDMRSRGVDRDRINVLDKKYFVLNPRKKQPALNEIVFGEKAAAVCKATIGDTAYLHNEQFVVKMMDTETSFAWHQDSGYSVYQGGAAIHKPYITCWIALDDMSVANGTISILPFSRAGSRDLVQHVWVEEQNAMVGYQGEDPGDPVEVSAGTLVAFSSFLFHKSGANTTDRPRRSYFIAYTPELFTYADQSKGVYSSADPLIIKGEKSNIKLTQV